MFLTSNNGDITFIRSAYYYSRQFKSQLSIFGRGKSYWLEVRKEKRKNHIPKLVEGKIKDILFFSFGSVEEEIEVWIFTKLERL